MKKMEHWLITDINGDWMIRGFYDAASLAHAHERADVKGKEVTKIDDLKQFSNPELVAIRNKMSAGKPIKVFQNSEKARAAVWGLFVDRKEPEEPDAEKKDLPADTTAGNVATDGSEAGASGEASVEEDMAKAKAKTKRAAKPKTNGASGPRGEKTKKIRSMLLRDSGCTREQVLEATGWPSVSMQQMAKACGLKLKKEKEKGSPTRYFGAE